MVCGKPCQSDRLRDLDGSRWYGLDGILSAWWCFPRDLLGGQTVFRRHQSKPSKLSRSVARDVCTSGPICLRFALPALQSPFDYNRMAGNRLMQRLPAIFFARAPHAMETNTSAYFLASSFGFSAIRASLVSSSVATLAAFSSAARTTFTGSITPASTKSSYTSVAAL